MYVVIISTTIVVMCTRNIIICSTKSHHLMHASENEINQDNSESITTMKNRSLNEINRRNKKILDNKPLI
jgi:hypothetical protein